MKNNIVIIIAITSLALGFGGGYFFKNYQFGKMRPNFGGQLPSRQGNGQGLQNVQRSQNGQGSQAGFGGMFMGEIISQDENSITVKVQDGSTKRVILGDSTTYSKIENVKKAELSTGNQVRIFGGANSDGSITAQNIQINPTEN